ncbi:HES6 protein, partial [Grallaria varia]|nr:HES6 protein [Grallaria varia]
QTRKPLVEKKRRARINESLRELRLLLADSEFQAKLEKAEVLERTVRRVRAVLERRGGGRRLLEASERFAAGYIQCMHEVHTFVSSCPGIDAATAAELLNHLLQAMPLGGAACPPALTDAQGAEAEALPLPLPCPEEEDTCSDSDEPEAEPGQTPAHGLDASQTRGLALPGLSKSMWRPW